MLKYLLQTLVATAFVFGLLSQSEAYAGVVPIPISWGSSITHYGDSAPQAQPANKVDLLFNRLMKPVNPFKKVGYKYDYFAVVWCNVWTHGGEFCTYEGDRYIPITQSEAAKLLGKKEADLTTPFFYRVPFGLPIIVLLCIGGFLSALSEEEGADVNLLCQDPNYIDACKVVMDRLREGSGGNPEDAPSVEAATSLSDAAKSPSSVGETAPTDPTVPADPTDEANSPNAFEAGVQHLVGCGIDRKKAETNLALVIKKMTASVKSD